MTDLMPAIFFGRGNPMNALSRNIYTDGWVSIGKSIPHPKAVLAICLSITISHASDLNQDYASDYEAFWKQWNKSKENATTCIDYGATSKFLSNALITLGNAEVSEANSEIIEILCLRKSECLLESLLALRTEDQEKIMKYFITKPMFHESAEIEKSLDGYWNLPKYKPIKNLYDKMRQYS
jgi:hypothetical protein